jgi:uncharacterized membrane protein YgcG
MLSTVKNLLLCTAALLLAAGCGKSEKPKSSKIVEDLTGYSTIKKGEAIKKQLHEYEQEQQKREKELEAIK